MHRDLVTIDEDGHAFDEAAGVLEAVGQRAEIPDQGFPIDARAPGDLVDRVIPIVGERGDEMENPAELCGGGLHQAGSG